MSHRLLVFIYLKRREGGGGSQFTLLPTFFWYGIHRLKRGYDFRLMLFMLKSLKVWPFLFIVETGLQTVIPFSYLSNLFRLKHAYHMVAFYSGKHWVAQK